MVSNNLKKSPKRFWSYIKSKRQESTGVSPLINKDSYLQSDSKQKADILNSQFQSVYTQENTDSIPDKGPSPHPTMTGLKIQPAGVTKLLRDLKPHKASGPDSIPTFFLQVAAEELSPILSRLPLTVKMYHQIGGVPTSSLFTRKATNTRPRIIDQCH